MGFEQTGSDPCFYVHANSEGEIFVVAVCVDHIILGGNSKSKLNQVKQELSQKFGSRTTTSLDLSKKTLQEMIIYEDNQSTICLAMNQIYRYKVSLYL